MDTNKALAKMFAELWDIFTDGGSLEGFDLQDMVEKTGLAEWRPCTEEEAADMGPDIAEGESALFLTTEGKKVVEFGKEA